MTTNYTRTQSVGNWQALPSTATPISPAFLESVEGFLDKLTLPTFVSGESSFQAAIDNAPDRGTVWVDVDVTVTAALTKPSGKSIRIESVDGRRITQGADVEVFQFTDTKTDTVSISSLTTADVAMTSGDSTLKNVAQFTVASVPSWLVPGARIKVGADDAIPGAFVSGGAIMRLGQFATVHSISGSVVTLTEIPYQWSAYGTTPRVSEAPTSTVQLVGLDIVGGAAGVAGDWTSKLIDIISSRSVLIRDVRVTNANSRAVSLQGVDGAHVDHLEVDGAIDEPTDGQYGYGLALTACEHVTVVAPRFYRCRHGFTTDGSYLSAQQTHLTRYGRTKWVEVIGGRARDCTSAGFDTHTDAWRVKFTACNSISDIRGPNGIGAGFQLRGHGVSCHGCRAEGSQTGFIFSNQATADGAKDVELVDCTALVEDQAAWVLANGQTLTGSRINGGAFESTANHTTVQVDDATLRMRGARVKTNQSSSDCIRLQGTGAEVLSIDCEFDIRDTAGSPRLVEMRTAAANQKAVLVRPIINCQTYHTMMTATSGDTSAEGHLVDAVYEAGEAATKFNADLLNGTTSSTTAYA